MSNESSLEVRLGKIEEDFVSLSGRMADPAVAGDPSAYRELATRYAELEPLVNSFRAYRDAGEGLVSARAMLEEESDAELVEMAREEISELEAAREALFVKIRALLLPQDPNDEKDVILEVRAGTGGDEATLFAGELVEMYQRLAERRGWTFEVVELSTNEIGGAKEAIINISGKRVYSQLKYESGVHRVQRVPTTETQGRVHTSAATVAIMPEAEEVEVELDESKDLRIDSFRSSGPGGQSVNKTTSAVRLTHIPTGMVVQCQDEKSWHKNKAKALKVLRTRLYDQEIASQQAQERDIRRVQIGSGDRSEKIRTYNFPQNRVTDHRIKLTLHRLAQIMLGDLDELIEALEQADQTKRLAMETES